MIANRNRKMADERGIELPEDTDWPYLRKQSATDLLDTYVEALRILGKQHGMLGDIFRGSQSRFTNPVNLRKLIGIIDETEWTALDTDVKAAAFEGLLEKAAAEGKKGAGQYFTPRPLIQSMVRCIKPDPRASKDFKIGDPACGTGGRLRMAKGPDWGSIRPRDSVTSSQADILRARAGGATDAPCANEPVPSPGRASYHPGRFDLRGATG